MDSLNPVQRPRTNIFDLSHELKTTVDMGYLTPMLLLEALPGDKFLIKPELMARWIPQLAPVMHRVHVIQDFYFVPTRIMWENWQKWMVGELEAEPPYLNLTGAELPAIARSETLHYLGVPAGISLAQINNYKISAFPFAAYQRIYNEYYRDQNLITENVWATDTLNNGANTLPAAERLKFKRAWEHDYFTSNLPWAQKGDPVTIPLFEDGKGNVLLDSTAASPLWRNNVTNAVATTAVGSLGLGAGILYSGTGQYDFDPNGSLYVADGEAAMINDLRAAFALQAYLEKNARGGTRYIEWIQQHFGQSSSDGRLQRPEFIGRMKQNVVFSEVLSTAETTDVVGALAGHGITFSAGSTIKWKAEEHGYIMSIMNFQPTTAYSQGLHKLWRRHDPLDYPIPVFAHLGEQETLQVEIDARNITGQWLSTFGYLPRYQEHRTMYDRFSGAFVDDYLFWHLGRQFGLTPPQLNKTFIEADVTTRIFAVETTEQDTIQVSAYYDIKKISKLPRYGIPSLVG